MGHLKQLNIDQAIKTENDFKNKKNWNEDTPLIYDPALTL